LALELRKLAAGFPPGYGEFKEQLTSAAESIASNIVEGAAAASKKEFARFLDFSIKSSIEVEYRLQLAFDYALVGEAMWETYTDEVVEIRKMTFGLKKSVLGGSR
jgi:four helix bundle protein